MCDYNNLHDSLMERTGPEHERLESELRAWAKDHGYDVKADFKYGSPDVVLTSRCRKRVFVGDAKDANNETAGDRDVADQIRKYQNEFLRLLQNSTYHKGIFAISTNCEDAANDWVDVLNNHTGEGEMNFTNKEINSGKTWVVYAFVHPELKRSEMIQ